MYLLARGNKATTHSKRDNIMNNSNIFKAAHALTKATVKAGDSYSATFAICLKFTYAENKKSKPDVTVGGWYNIVRAHLFGADIHHADKRNTMQLVSMSNGKAVFLSLHAHNDTVFEVDNNKLKNLLASNDIKRTSEFHEARYKKAGLSRI